MMRWICYLSIAVAVSCFTPAPRHPYVGSLPGYPGYIDLDIDGHFVVTPSGDLQLDLDKGCEVRKTGTSGSDGCPPNFLEQIKVIAHSPWGQDIEGAWTHPGQIVFRIDWTTTGIDPLADD